MKRFALMTTAAMVAALATAAHAANAARADFSWQQPHARVLPNGDLEWAPKAFVFEKGASVRYIDFDAGDDTKDGRTRQTAWKHHPWDASAAGLARECTGIHTYVFKRGVAYRGMLKASDSGKQGNPIRLTSDPAWGTGEAALYGSTMVTGGWKRCAAADAPAGMPEPRKVWYLDIGTEFNPRCVFETRTAAIHRIHIARNPNFSESNPDDLMADWFTWTGPSNWSFTNEDTAHLVQQDPHFYDGAHIWSEWGDQWDNMGLPRFFPAGTYDPRAHTIERRGFVHGKANIGHRYYIENLAAFLDSPGEYYYAGKGAHSGRLYLRLPDDRDPNHSVVELGREVNLIDIRDQSHIAITGLRFSFMNLPRGDDPMTIFANPAVYGRAVAVRLMGDCRGIRVANCRFLHVPGAVQGSPRISPDMLNWPYADLKAKTTRDLMDEIEITDNDIDHADAVAIELQDGGAGYGRKNDELLIGELGRVHILRNRVHDAVFRNGASGNGPAIGVTCASLVEIAGNFIDRAWGVGIWCLGGKGGGDERNRPLIRNLVHHNKLTNVLLGCNDWGGMAIWQGGSSYAYCNIVYNPLGLKHMIKAGGLPWRIQEWSCNGFAYYLDGTYKSYIFNNIAWGKFNDLDNWLKNRSAFMMVLGFQNNWFNNTVYKFCYGVTGSSGQRNTMLGNIFADISNKFFGQDAPGDISLHMGQIAAGRSAEKTSAASTLAYGFNVYYGTPTSFGRLVGKDTAADIEAFRRGLADATPRAGDVGVMSPDMPLADPDKGDFRPRPGSVAAGRGVRFFVPWSLYMTVGEWSFTRFNADPTVVLGENFFMSDEYVTREMYYEIPRNDLTAVGAKAEDYVKGALEDWTDGALMFNGRDRFCILKDRELKSDYPVTQAFVEDKGKREQRNGTFTYPGSKRRTVDMGVNSFLIEAYLKTTAGLTGAVVVSKAAESGYVLDIGSRGRVRLTIRAGGKEACSRTSSVAVNDGKWHHVIAEVDRAAREGIAIYVDGKAANGTFTGLMPDGNVSLKNSADFLVGKGAAGGFFAGAIDFLRVCRGTLADSKTTIEELYAWQFSGPFLKDFRGNTPVEGTRDAGALQRD